MLSHDSLLPTSTSRTLSEDLLSSRSAYTEVLLPRVQVSIFAFKEFQKVPLFPSLPPVEILLKSCITLWGVGHSSQLWVVRELAEEISASSSKSLMSKLKQY